MRGLSSSSRVIAHDNADPTSLLTRGGAALGAATVNVRAHEAAQVLALRCRCRSPRSEPLPAASPPHSPLPTGYPPLHTPGARRSVDARLSVRAWAAGRRRAFPTASLLVRGWAAGRRRAFPTVSLLVRGWAAGRRRAFPTASRHGWRTGRTGRRRRRSLDSSCVPLECRIANTPRRRNLGAHSHSTPPPLRMRAVGGATRAARIEAPHRKVQSPRAARRGGVRPPASRGAWPGGGRPAGVIHSYTLTVDF